MKKFVRLVFVLAVCLALALPSFAEGLGCPDLYVSCDGGQTWQQCEVFEGINPDGSVSFCMYLCPNCALLID